MRLKTSVYEFGKFRLDPLKRRLSEEGVNVSLTEEPFDLLLYLVRHQAKRPDGTIRRTTLLKGGWYLSGGKQFTEDSLKPIFGQIYKALRDTDRAHPKYIKRDKHVWFLVPVRVVPPDHETTVAKGSSQARTQRLPESNAGPGMDQPETSAGTIAASSAVSPPTSEVPGTVSPATPVFSVPQLELEFFRQVLARTSSKEKAGQLTAVRDALGRSDYSEAVRLATDLSVDGLSDGEARELLSILLICQDRLVGFEKTPGRLSMRKLGRRLIEAAPLDLLVRHCFFFDLARNATEHSGQNRHAEGASVLEEFFSLRQKYPLAPSEARWLPVFLPLKLAFLCELGRVDKDTLGVAIELLEIEPERFDRDMYPRMLAMVLYVFRHLEDHGRTGLTDQKIQSVFQDNPSIAISFFDMLLVIAKQWGCDELVEQRLYLLDDLIDRLWRGQETRLDGLLSKAHHSKLACLIQFGRHVDVVSAYEEMTEHCRSTNDIVVAEHLACAGTGATRSLRSLDRHADADLLALSLAHRFGNHTLPAIRKACGWALAEQWRTCEDQENFSDGITRLNEFLAAWDLPDRVQHVKDSLAWAYARKAFSYRKAGRCDEAVVLVDEIVQRFGRETDVEILEEVAYAMVEQIIALHRSKRITAAIAAADAASARFADSKERQVSAEMAWVIHQKGAALLSEGKLYRLNGLPDDASRKLQEARDCFAAAMLRDGDEPRHVVCKSHAEFLLGRSDEAEETLGRAAAISNAWFGYNWNDSNLFPVPEDEIFLAAVKRWSDKGAVEGSPVAAPGVSGKTDP